MAGQGAQVHGQLLVSQMVGQLPEECLVGRGRRAEAWGQGGGDMGRSGPGNQIAMGKFMVRDSLQVYHYLMTIPGAASLSLAQSQKKTRAVLRTGDALGR